MMTDPYDISAPVIYDLVLRSRRTVLPDGERPAAIAIAGERIAVIGDYDEPIPAHRTEDLHDLALLPGLVDTHVHVNEPGRTAWEGFATATRAAAAGGVTTIVDMPLNSLPPTVDTAALAAKRAAAEGKTWVDTGFWGGAIPGNDADLKGLHDAGVFGFKCFTAPSGVDEFPPLDPAGLRRACATVAALDSLLIVHAEDPAHLHETDGTLPIYGSQASPRGPIYGSQASPRGPIHGSQASPRGPIHGSQASPREPIHGSQASPWVGFEAFLATRPAVAETSAIRGVIAAAKATGARVHILHLAAAEALAEISDAWLDGIRITVETCPHYLTLAAEQIADGATAFKCCPPIRGEANREALWAGLIDGQIDIVVSDHSPSPPSMKTGDFATAWGGIASIQLGLPVMWTEARRRGWALSDIVRWMCAGPADLVGLHRKGRIAAGADADFAVFDPEREWTVRAADLLHRHPVTPYDGQALTGQVVSTWLRGKRIDTDAAPRGRQLRRSPR